MTLIDFIPKTGGAIIRSGNRTGVMDKKLKILYVDVKPFSRWLVGH